MAARMPAIGRTKYSIIPFVSGWFTSKRENSPSHTRSMPACSWVWITTRVASIKACSDGKANSQSGAGYEPTTVVLMRGAAVIGRGPCCAQSNPLVSDWLVIALAPGPGQQQIKDENDRRRNDSPRRGVAGSFSRRRSPRRRDDRAVGGARRRHGKDSRRSHHPRRRRQNRPDAGTTGEAFCAVQARRGRRTFPRGWPARQADWLGRRVH